MWMDISGSRQGKLLIIPKSGPIVKPVGLEMVKDFVVLLVQEVFHEEEVSLKRHVMHIKLKIVILLQMIFIKSALQSKK